jgi:hypothetical protein
MAFTVTDFIKEAQDGARPTLFIAYLDWPTGIPGLGAEARAPFLIKATSIPGMTVGMIEVPFFGRKIKIAGDRTFEDWSTTIINDEEFLVRSRIEAWNEAINGVLSNSPSIQTPLGYRGRARLIQFSQRGVPIRQYVFENIWPSSVASIDLSWESNDALEEFEVTWTYDYWRNGAGASSAFGSIGDNLGRSIRDI